MTALPEINAVFQKQSSIGMAKRVKMQIRIDVIFENRTCALIGMELPVLIAKNQRVVVYHSETFKTDLFALISFTCICTMDRADAVAGIPVFPGLP